MRFLDIDYFDSHLNVLHWILPAVPIFYNYWMKLLEGLPARNKNFLFLATGYTLAVELYVWSVSRENSQRRKHEFIEYYRHAGHYKHPWANDPHPVPEHVKATDYAKMIETPQGLRYYQLGHRV